MLVSSTLAEEILDLKQARRAILLAHHYQESEIQDLADASATAWSWPARRGSSMAT